LGQKPGFSGNLLFGFFSLMQRGAIPNEALDMGEQPAKFSAELD
jgi:hypothetical protein